MFRIVIAIYGFVKTITFSSPPPYSVICKKFHPYSGYYVPILFDFFFQYVPPQNYYAN